MKMGLNLLLKIEYSYSYFSCFSLEETQAQVKIFLQCRGYVQVLRKRACFEILHNELFKYSIPTYTKKCTQFLLVLSF
jgi:hypothetical protein